MRVSTSLVAVVLLACSCVAPDDDSCVAPDDETIGAASQAGNRSQGNRSQGNRSQGNRSQGNRSQGNRSQGPVDSFLVYGKLKQVKSSTGTAQKLDVAQGRLVLERAIATSAGAASLKACTTVPAVLDARRNCGWRTDRVGKCTYLATGNPTVTVGLDDSQGMVRICKGATACNTVTTGTNYVLAQGPAVQGSPPVVSFPCPSGGLFTVMVARGLPDAAGSLAPPSRPALARFSGGKGEYPTGSTASLVGAVVEGEDSDGKPVLLKVTAVATPSATKYPELAGTLLYQLTMTTADGSSGLLCDANDPTVDPTLGVPAHSAIMIAGKLNLDGSWLRSNDVVTPACAAGTLAKVYAWGFRPWRHVPVGDLDMARAVFVTANRAATADYCGDGSSHTFAGNVIDIMLAPSLVPYYPASFASLETRDNPLWLDEGVWGESGISCWSAIRYKYFSGFDTLVPALCDGAFGPDRRGICLEPGVTGGGLLGTRTRPSYASLEPTPIADAVDGLVGPTLSGAATISTAGADFAIGRLSVEVDISHPCVEELTLRLSHSEMWGPGDPGVPAGSVVLWDRGLAAGGELPLVPTCTSGLKMEFADPLVAFPFAGSYPGGEWYLEVTDHRPLNQGTLNKWFLRVYPETVTSGR